MGSCISKCRPKRKKFKPHCSQEDISHVHDKLVISPSSSSASLSSFSGPTTSASSLSTFSSSSSSVSILKDRSFSNEFLWSSAKKSPHIIGKSLIREKVHPQVLEPASREQVPLKQATPKKRARTNSPRLVRQKSFRKEPDRDSSISHVPNRSLRSSSPSRGVNSVQCFGESLTSRNLRSPSPSRRFNGDQSFRDSYTSTMKHSMAAKTSMNKQNLRSPTVNFHSKDRKDPFKSTTRGAFCHQIGSRIDENALEEEKQDHGVEVMVVEDFNNPLIALDCFIFL